MPTDAFGKELSVGWIIIIVKEIGRCPKNTGLNFMRVSKLSHQVHMSLAVVLALAALFCLALLTTLTFYSTNRLETCNAAVDHTYDVQQALADTNGNVEAMTVSSRDYLLTGDVRYLRTSQLAQQRTRTTFSRALSLTARESDMHDRLNRLWPSVAVLMQNTDAACGLRADGDASGAKRIVLNAVRLLLAERISIGLSDMQASEQQVLSRQIATVTVQSDESGALVTADVGSVVVFLLLVIIIVRRDFSAQVRHYVQIVDDQKHELERANRELAELAMRDGLTGLINHRTFHERLAAELSRNHGSHCTTSLLMIDVDHFKLYNDSYGHPAGDALLRRLAVILSDCARSSDIVARYGGEEFAILLPLTEASGAMELAERLRKRIESEKRQLSGITVSVGVANSDRNRLSAGELVGQADRALYQSKEGGRNKVTLAAAAQLDAA